MAYGEHAAGSGGIIAALNADWVRLTNESDALAAVWSSRHAALTGCAQLDQILAATRVDPDGVLGALLAEVGDGSDLAARAVLQSMLGKLVRMAGRTSRAGVDDFVAALWCRILSYPLHRRPSRIAANLALDTLKDVTSGHRLDSLETLTPWPPDEHLEELLHRRRVDDPVTAERLLSAASRVGLIDRRTTILMRAVYVDGLTSQDAGTRFATSAAMVRYRCSQAVRRISAARFELADAA